MAKTGNPYPTHNGEMERFDCFFDTMTEQASVTLWINALRRGDAVAADQLWHRYFAQLMAQARARMSNLSPAGYDAEDAALSTFNVLVSRLRDGHYPALADRDELWQLMLTVLARKIGRRAKYQQASKRLLPAQDLDRIPLEAVPDTTRQEISQECFELLASLNDPNLEQVALLKFEGYTNEEIADKLNRTRRTIQRMLNLIRDLWQETLDREQSS